MSQGLTQQHVELPQKLEQEATLEMKDSSKIAEAMMNDPNLYNQVLEKLNVHKIEKGETNSHVSLKESRFHVTENRIVQDHSDEDMISARELKKLVKRNKYMESSSSTSSYDSSEDEHALMKQVKLSRKMLREADKMKQSYKKMKRIAQE